MSAHMCSCARGGQRLVPAAFVLIYSRQDPSLNIKAADLQYHQRGSQRSRQEARGRSSACSWDSFPPVSCLTQSSAIVSCFVMFSCCLLEDEMDVEEGDAGRSGRKGNWCGCAV